LLEQQILGAVVVAAVAVLGLAVLAALESLLFVGLHHNRYPLPQQEALR